MTLRSKCGGRLNRKPSTQLLLNNRSRRRRYIDHSTITRGDSHISITIQQAIDTISATVPGGPPRDTVDTVKIGDPAQLEAGACQRESPDRRSAWPAIDSHLRIDQEFKCKGRHAVHNPESQGYVDQG
jgi:hypothetical protein